MLKEYSNHNIERIYYPYHKLIERYDLHFQDSKSDKVYICLLLEEKNAVGQKFYKACALYGKRGLSLSNTLLGTSVAIATAHKAMQKQMNTKLKKGYLDVGHYVDPNAKASANGALGSKVLDFLRETYPANSIIESPNGNRGTVLSIEDNGAMKILLGSKELEFAFGKYGMLKVVEDNG